MKVPDLYFGRYIYVLISFFKIRFKRVLFPVPFSPHRAVLEPFNILNPALSNIFRNTVWCFRGVAEAALRMAVEKLTGKVLTDHLEFEEIRGFEGVKESTIDVNGTKVRVAVVSGLKNAEPIIEKILNGVDVGYDLIEVMACPGGCICGAGHPVPEKIDSLEKRQQVLVNIDKVSKYRKSRRIRIS